MGSFSVVLCIRHIEGPPRLGPYSVDRHVRQLKVMLGGVLLCSQRVRHLLGQPLCCSAAHAGMWGVRGYRDGSTHYAWLSSIAWLPQLPGLHPQAFPTAALDLTWECSTILQVQLPAAVSSRGPATLSGVCMAAARTVWFSFHLGC